MALAQRKSSSWTRRHTQGGPTLNTYDVPEMMLGAQPSANSVERERFNQRCKKLWEDDNRQASEETEVLQHKQAMERHSQLQTIFPDLDPDMIWKMCHETRSIQEAVDTLLAFSASMSADAAISASTDAEVASMSADAGINASTGAEVGANASSATLSVDLATQQPTESPKDGALKDDAGTWPALMDSDGWEVVSYQALQQQGQDLGNAWCKTAKDAAHLPAPRPSPSTAAQPKQKQKESHGALQTEDCIDEDGLPTDYDLRLMRGQMRASKLAIKAVARGANQACNDAPEQKEQLASECGSSCGMLSESEIQQI